MKRIYALIICFCLMLSVMPPLASVGAEEQAKHDNVYEPYAESEGFLKGIGVFEEGFAAKEESITRGTAAKWIVQMLNEQGNLSQHRGVFADVTSDNENAPYIEKLADLGIVRGNENRCYEADSYLGYPEAYTIFANVWGLETATSAAEVTKIITQYDINDGVKAESAYVTDSDFILMMYNILMSKVLDQTVWGGDGSVYMVSDDTLLNKIYDISYCDGVIIKNDLTYIWSSNADEDSSIELECADGAKVGINVTADKLDGVRGDIGKNVRVFYKFDTSKSKTEYVYHQQMNNKIIKLDLDQISGNNIDIDKGKLSYSTYESYKKKDISLSADCALMYNNVAYKSRSVKLDSASSGYAELIDNDADGTYEVVKVKEYTSIIVGNISANDQRLFDRYDSNSSVILDADEYRKVFLYNANGESIAFEDIAYDNVISYAISDAYTDNKTIEAYVSNTRVNGIVTDNKTSKTPATIEIDDKEYLAKGRACKIDWTIGKGALAYVNAFGEIVYLTEDYGRDLQYGIVTQMKCDVVGFSKSLSLKIINMDCAEETLDVADAVTVDGVRYKNEAEKVYNKLSDAKLELTDVTLPENYTVITYKKGSDNKIRIIDTIKTADKGDNDCLEYMGGGTFVLNSGNIFGWTVPFKEDALTMSVDTSQDEWWNEASGCGMQAISAYKKGVKYKVMAFKCNADSIYADFIINYTDTSIQHDNELFVIDTMYEQYDNAEQKTVTCIAGYSGSAYTEAKVHPDNTELANELKKFKTGDTIRISVNSMNYIVEYNPVLIQNSDDDGFKLSFEKGSASAVNVSALDRTTSKSTVIYGGYVYSKNDNIIATDLYGYEKGKVYDFAQTSNAGDVSWDTAELYYANVLSTTSVIVVDKNERIKVRVGDVGDIRDFEGYKDEASFIVAKFRSSQLKNIVIYR